MMHGQKNIKFWFSVSNVIIFCGLGLRRCSPLTVWGFKFIYILLKTSENTSKKSYYIRLVLNSWHVEILYSRNIIYFQDKIKLNIFQA